MSSPHLLLVGNPSLSRRSRSQTDETLAKLIRTNFNTRFAQTASELTEFRDAIAGGIDSIDDISLVDTFRSTVRFTTYEAYAPLLARFQEKPCRKRTVVDLFAPELPDYLVWSSSTSGGVMKMFPKYNRLGGPSSSSVPDTKRTKAFIFQFAHRTLKIEDEDGRLVKKVYSTGASSMGKRTSFGLDPKNDEERMATFVLDHVQPFAAGFISIWRSFVLIHALFALDRKILESMDMPFLSTFVDMMRHIDAEFDMIVDCIEKGRIPDLEGTSEVRHHLEPNFVPNPGRAEELRRLGRPSSLPGWCSHVWPNLRSITAISSGSFASYVPLARWFLGPDTDILAAGYGSSEAWIGPPYNPHELNQFKLNNGIIIEFLDISKSDCIASIAQPWEVRRGKRYEILLTTLDGLWRYRIRDVVDIAGFDPEDGAPIIEFVQRQNVALRHPSFMLDEKELRTAMSFVVTNVLGNIVDWTCAIDERQLPSTIGFFVELADDKVISDLSLATERTLDFLVRSNESISSAFDRLKFGKPTIRIVVPGTFSEFRQLKIDQGASFGMGQVKIPVVLPKAAYLEWFSDRVAREL